MTDQYFGLTLVAKHGPAVGHQAPLQGQGANALNLSKEHAHQGHVDTHDRFYRHRKQSQDPLHGEEDKLLDEWRGLFEKASKGMCTPQELHRIAEIRAALGDIDSRRQDEARRILGNFAHELKEAQSSYGDYADRDMEPYEDYPEELEKDGYDITSPSSSFNSTAPGPGVYKSLPVITSGYSFQQRAINNTIGFDSTTMDPLDAVIMLGNKIAEDFDVVSKSMSKMPR